MRNLYRIKNRTYNNFMAVQNALLPYFGKDEAWTITNCIFSALEFKGNKDDNAGYYTYGIISARDTLAKQIAYHTAKAAECGIKFNREMVYYNYLNV